MSAALFCRTGSFCPGEHTYGYPRRYQAGEREEYYFRYLIVKSQTGKYYFWPTGFGLDGSLEECAAARHYMNRLCIERTKQLERSEFEITVP